MWNTGLYNQFKAVHFSSFSDLLRLVVKRPNLRVLDLGCGTGELTRRLADSLPDSEVLGVDSSPEMLRETTAFATPRLRFEQQTIEETAALKQRWDLVFSKTALQYVPDHRALFPRLIAAVAPGGQLVVEMGVMDAFFLKRDLDALAGTEPFRTGLDGWTWRSPVLGSEEYATILFEHGGADITAFEKVYPDVLPDAEALFDFVKGSPLITYLGRLPPQQQPLFMEEYRKALLTKHPQKPLFFPAKRVVLAATFCGLERYCKQA